MAFASQPELDSPQLLAMPLRWRETTDADRPYRCTLRQTRLEIQLNEFPDEPLYSLLADGKKVCDLEEWPENWSR